MLLSVMFTPKIHGCILIVQSHVKYFILHLLYFAHIDVSYVSTLIVPDIFLCTTLFPNFNPVNSKDSIYSYVLTNSVDPDQLAPQKPADLDLHCFQNKRYPGLAW